MKIAGVDSRDEAEAIVGQVLFVDQKNAVKLPKGRYFIHDLIGMAVVDDEGNALGTLDDVLQYPANHIYVVRGNGREIMVPAVKDFIKAIDPATRTMTVHLIEGMVE
jgi:16S rRNA processing protein RimM